MSVLFCIPPGSSYVPYPAVPYLVGSLKKAGIEAVVCDLNIIAFNFGLELQGYQILPNVVLQRRAGQEVCKIAQGHLQEEISRATSSLNQVLLRDAALDLGIDVPDRLGGDAAHAPATKMVIGTWQKWIEKWIRSSERANIVGFHVISDLGLLWSLLLARIVKNFQHNALTILGGPLVANYADRIGCYPEVDGIIYGEGEEAITQVASRFDGSITSIRGVLGLGLRVSPTAFKITPQVVDACPLDRLPFPDFGALPLEDYPQHRFGVPLLPLVGSRGCIGKCTFCAERYIWPKYRTRTAQNIVDEIEHTCKAYKVGHIRFNDSLINADIARLEVFSTALSNRGLGVEWVGNARIRQEMTVTLLGRMYAAGCRGLFYGLESGSPRILNKMKKGFKVETARDVIRATAESGIFVLVFVIVGFPGETFLDFERTIEFVEKNQNYIDALHVSEFHLYRESEIYRHPERFGLSIDRLSSSNVDYSFYSKPLIQDYRADLLRQIWLKGKKGGRAMPFPVLAPSI